MNNIIRNGDFEDGDAYWSSHGPVGTSIGSDGCEHGQCLRLAQLGIAYQTGIGRAYAFSRLRLRFKPSVEPDAMPRLRIAISYRDGGGELVLPILTGEAANTWHDVDFPIWSGDINSLELANWSQEEAYFIIDDISLDDGYIPLQYHHRPLPPAEPPYGADGRGFGPDPFGMLRFMERRLTSLEYRLIEITNAIKSQGRPKKLSKKDSK